MHTTINVHLDGLPRMHPRNRDGAFWIVIEDGKGSAFAVFPQFTRDEDLFRRAAAAFNAVMAEADEEKEAAE
jgi:hypothetical protein